MKHEESAVVETAKREASRRRETPYVWITWLTKLLVGNDHCVWSTWFRANHENYAKLTRTFDVGAWSIKHATFLDAVAMNYEQRFLSVRREHQNAFRFRGRSGAVLAGKPDLVGYSETEARICDVKSGQQRDEHWVQMMLYMYVLPKCYPRLFDGLQITGELIYEDGKQEVYMDEFTDSFRDRVFTLLASITSLTPPVRVPSLRECNACPITTADCDDRFDSNVELHQTELGEF